MCQVALGGGGLSAPITQEGACRVDGRRCALEGGGGRGGWIGKWMRRSQWLGGAATVRGIYRLRAQTNIISTVLTGSRAERSSRWADSQEAVYTSSEGKIKKKEKTCMRRQENCSVSLCGLHSRGRRVREAGQHSEQRSGRFLLCGVAAGRRRLQADRELQTERYRDVD